MKILAIDTTTDVLGIGIATEDSIIGEYVTNVKKNHAVRVLPAMERLVADCNLLINDMDKIVVSHGPGSYTGVRIGVTVAKTLAWSLNIPIVGVSSLKLMAATARHFQGFISPLIDARRGNIYTGLYQWKNNKIVEVVEDRHISSEDWVKQLKDYKQPVLFIGTDGQLHKELINSHLAQLASFSEITENIPRPGELALLGKDMKGENVHTFVPNYLRLAEAEAKWREKTGI
ncbi:tRNA (adenosine(37)-N6)-threonylcarbamoyltransferase complex dimerization subunit type 1 TsaB [Bacillus kwashiorkori]|uniref:tRNA (adenosine(37)-N6)-threonylcarbamoyltransferase complex dimerization subunit type 1 TsaB n=1 Tax=Bacillus kwashiorkori TaxID=1522318 RepID=UPI0007853006|nr:tRNA (adenosine(37)-N6)-threonylcarbamoyltransferase complex dimerization subunit type 1 TsaB [Bacillus kwashiorkori]